MRLRGGLLTGPRMGQSSLSPKSDRAATETTAISVVLLTVQVRLSLNLCVFACGFSVFPSWSGLALKAAPRSPNRYAAKTGPKPLGFVEQGIITRLIRDTLGKG